MLVGNVRDAYGALGLVDVLAARAARPINVDAHVFFAHVDLDLVVDHRKHADGREAGVAARVGIEGRNPHQPVHARLRLQPAIGVRALDHDGGRLDAGLFAFALLDVFDLIALALGPARVHAQQHVGPILALGAARAGVDFQIGVIGVGLARQHGFELDRAARARAGRERRLALRPPSPCRCRLRPARSGRQRHSARLRAWYTATARCPDACARASASARPRACSTIWGLRLWRSVRRGGAWHCPSQRCLLSRSSDCLISAMVFSVSARMALESNPRWLLI